MIKGCIVMKLTTKQKILYVLKKDHDITMNKIMKHFTISEIAVRKHIHKLEQQGFIRKHTHKQDIGRPYYTYSLTEKGHKTFPNQDGNLALQLLQDLEGVQGSQAVTDILSKRMEREKNSFHEKIKNKKLDEKISRIACMQNEKGYMTEVKKSEDGTYEIIYYNCPVASIANSYNEICKNDKRVFEELFSDCEVLSRSLITKGDPHCRWTIKKRTKDDLR